MPNIIKKITIIAIVVTTSFISNGQSTFEKVFDDLGYSEIRATIETSDNDFIFSVTPSEVTGSNDLIVKISAQGEMIGSLDYKITDGYLKYLGLFRHSELDDAFVTPAIVYDGAVSKEIAIVSFDNNLEIIDEKRVVFSDVVADLSPLVLPSVTAYDDEIAMAAHVLLDDGVYAQLYARMDVDGLLKAVGFDYKYSVFNSFVTSISLIDAQEKHFAVLNKANNSSDNIQLFVETLDSTMCVEKTQALVYDNSGSNDYISYVPMDTPVLKSFNDSTIMVNVIAHLFKSNGQQHYGNCLVSLDHNLQTKGTSLYFYDKPKKFVRLPLRNSFDIGYDCLVSCSIINWHSDHPMYKTQCLVTKYDTEMNVVWRRFVNEKEGYYYPCFVLATEDGGSLIAGYSCDLDYQHQYSYALKTDCDGYLSISDFHNFDIKPFALYPNPCTTNINVEISPDVEIDDVSIYDVSGRLVKTQNAGFETIDVSNFTSGVYVMKVTLENGTIFEEKIVKE